MARLVINNAHVQFISLLLSDNSLEEYYKYNLKPDMFGPCKDLMERIIDFADKHDGELPTVDTAECWVDETTFIACEKINDPEILARELQVRYFYSHDFCKMLNKTIDNIQLDPEECMREIAQFCIDNRDIIYKTSLPNTSLFKESLKDKLENPPKPIKTGINGLDLKLNGGLMDELVVLGGNTGTFKTTLIQAIADNIAQSGHHVTYISLEISKFDLMNKTICRKLKSVFNEEYSTSDIKRGLFSKDTYNHIESINLDFMDNITYIDSTDLENHEVDTIKSAIIGDIAQNGYKSVVIVDYLQLIQSSKKNSDARGTMDDAITMLKTITTKYNCPVIAISSIGRSFYKKKITRDSFKESGMIEYTSNLLLALNFPDDVFDTDNEGNLIDSVDPKKLEKWKANRFRDIEISILKNRDGVDGDNFIIAIDGKCCEITQTNITPKNESKSKDRPSRQSNTKAHDVF